MQIETFWQHWQITENPFRAEEARDDPVLRRLMEAQNTHPDFPKIYGQGDQPSSAVVFGEKGSGKSGLRLAVERRVALYNERHPEARILLVQYTDFDYFLEQMRRSAHLSADPERGAEEVVAAWRLADHLDAFLSLAVTRLVDELIQQRKAPRALTRQQRFDLLWLASLYYSSKRTSTADALRRARSILHYRSARPGTQRLGMLALAALGVALCLVPLWNELEIGPTWESGPAVPWLVGGGVALAAAGVWAAVERVRVRSAARRATRGVRVLARDPLPAAALLETLRPGARKEVAMPTGTGEATRYHLLQRLLAVLEPCGYACMYVVVDRVDESTLLAGSEEWTRRFAEKLLDHKLLQHPGLALKLFLPIELAKMYLGASPEQLKRMRLDKSNTLQELRWTGQELYEVANQRLRAARSDGEATGRCDLAGFFREDLPREELLDTLHELGTPRHAFGFLSTLFSEYARNLPEDLEEEAPEWRVPRAHFDVVRSAWADRSRVLRRALN